MYRIIFDGKYVKECDYEYLVECNKETSVFSDSIAQSIKKQCPDRVELELIQNQLSNATRYDPSLLDKIIIKKKKVK